MYVVDIEDTVLKTDPGRLPSRCMRSSRMAIDHCGDPLLI